ncbi:MAG: hypothetical protein ACK5Y2_02225 [Bdellovibrionales bacterium]
MLRLLCAWALLLSGRLYSQAPEVIRPENQTAAKQLGAELVSEISFDIGEYKLKPNEAQELRSVIEKARASKPSAIKKVEILTWADQNLPRPGEKETNSAVKLSALRSNEIKRLLKDQNISRIRVYNMAKRTSALQRLLQTTTAQVKGTFQGRTDQPATQSGPEDWHQGNSSKALVLISTQ